MIFFANHHHGNKRLPLMKQKAAEEAATSLIVGAAWCWQSCWCRVRGKVPLRILVLWHLPTPEVRKYPNSHSELRKAWYLTGDVQVWFATGGSPLTKHHKFQAGAGMLVQLPLPAPRSPPQHTHYCRLFLLLESFAVASMKTKATFTKARLKFFVWLLI